MLAKTLGPKRVVVPHIAQKREGKCLYIEDLNLIVLRHFLECISPIEKQNRGGHVKIHSLEPHNIE